MYIKISVSIIYFTHVNYIHVSMVRSGPHVTWLDNFSKFLSRSIPTADKNVYSQCLWTGEAVFGIHQSSEYNIDDSLIRDSSNQIIPNMPDRLITNDRKVQIENGLKIMHNSGRNYYASSLVVQYQINNVPLKIDTRRYPEMKHTIESKSNSTINLYPRRLIEHNISSNVGLINVLKLIYHETGMQDDSCQRYMYYNLDENIYWRVMKVCLRLLFRFYCLNSTYNAI